MIFDRPVGIDLGTTNSEIAMLEPSEREILIFADKFGRKTVPSAVAWDPKASAFLVGHAARARRGKEPPPIESIKRRMGQDQKVELGPSELLPEEISAKILAELTSRMREFVGARASQGIAVEIARAVITVPAYFDAPQIEATRKAGQLAGLDVVGILQEPTAAAIYHTWKSRLGDGTFLVYDLGGGTFDVSILRCLGGEYQVLAIDGDNYLGGDDLDRRFAEHLRKRLVKAGYALDLDVRGDAEDRRRFGRLVHLAQEIKESLSTGEVVSVSKQDFVDDKAGESVGFEAEIGRAEYEEVVGDLVAKTIECALRALERSQETANVGLADIDHVVLVGGSTRVPLVIKRVTEGLCLKSKAKAPLQDEVDTCVALGAAVHAAQVGGLALASDDGSTRVLFTTPLVAREAKTKLGVRVLAAPANVNEIALVRPAAGEVPAATLATAKLPAKRDDAVRLEVNVGDAAETSVELELRAGAAKVSSVPLSLYRGDVRPRASALSRPSVVAKDIAIEVVRMGKRERRVLIERGSGLPAEVFARFFTADQSGAVVLKLLQNRVPIKTLVVQVPPTTEVGTAVDLHLRCDEAMRLEAKAVVLGQELWARVEPAAQTRYDPKGAVDALLEEAEKVPKQVWGGVGSAYRREAETLTASIREAMQVDPDKTEALCNQLRQLIDAVQGESGDELSPPRDRFEATFSALQRIVYRSQGKLMGMDRSAWEDRISALRTRADDAYEARDATAWRRAVNEAQALHETANQEDWAATKVDDPAYVGERVRGLVRASRDIEESLADFVPSAAEEVRALQLAERDKLLVALRNNVGAHVDKLQVAEGDDVHAVRRRVEGLWNEVTRIRTAFERLPSLGVVTERGRDAASTGSSGSSSLS